MKTAGAAGIVGLAGCAQSTEGDGGDGESGSTGGGSSDDIGTVKWGFLNPMTGPYGGLAKGQRQGNKLAVEWINESDEFDFEIEPVFEDTEADPSIGQQRAQKLQQQEDVEYLMGAISSSVALGLNDFAKSNQVIYNPGAAAIDITGKKCNNYVFRFETSTAQMAEAGARYTMENVGTDAWFHIADYAWGNSVQTEWENRMNDAGDLTVVGTSKSDLGAGNYASYISQMANSDADVAVLGLNGGDLIKFLKQADGQDLQDDIELVSPTASFQVVRGAAGSAAAGVWSTVRYLPKLETGDNQEFVSEYTSAYDGATPDNFARVGFESVRMTARAIQKAGTSDPTEVADTLAGMEMETIYGQNKFRSCDHQAMNPVWMGQIQEPDGDGMPPVDVSSKIAGEDAIPPCSAVECSL